MNKQIQYPQKSEVSEWLEKITKSEKAYSDYHKLFEDIRKYYRNDLRKDKQNIFWSSVETLKPFLYFKQPKPYVDRKEKSDNKEAIEKNAEISILCENKPLFKAVMGQKNNRIAVKITKREK